MSSNITAAKRANIDPDLAAIIGIARKAASRHGVSVRALLNLAVVNVSGCRKGDDQLDFIPVGEA